MAIPYVPVVNNDSYKTPEKMFTLESVGMATDSEGFLKIEDPDLFTKTLGLRHSPESIIESGLKGFKDFDQFNRFLEKSVSDGLAIKDSSFYSNLQSEDFGLLRDYNKSTEAFKADSSISENIDKALGLDTQKGEPSDADAEVKVKDGMVFEKPGLALDTPAPAETQGNPYLFGTEGNQSQIANLSDIGNGKVAMPNRSDRRSMADFNESVMSKEFALNAAQRKARELESLEKGRRDKVSLTEPAMERWIKANPKSRAAKLALDADGNVDLSKISDAEKIQFTKNLNLGNIDFFNKPEGPKGVPVFDKDGLAGFENTKKFEEDMGGQQIRMNPDQPNRAQIRERRNNAMLDDIRSEIKETGKHPFGEGPILGTDYAREVELRDQMEGIDFGGLKKSARDFRDKPVRSRDYTQSIDLPSPMPANYADSKETFEPSQKMVSQDMLDRNNQEVNSVLDAVPFPRPKSPQAPKPKPRNPITTLPFSLEQPVSKQPTRTRASGDIDARKTSMTLDDLDLPTKIVNKLNLKPTYPFIGG